MDDIIEEHAYDTETDYFIPQESKRSSTSILRNSKGSKQRFSENNCNNIILSERLFRRSNNTNNSEGIRNSVDPQRISNTSSDKNIKEITSSSLDNRFTALSS